MSGPDLLINSKYPKAFLSWDFCKVAALPELRMETLGHTEGHCWWPWPLVGLVGAKGSLAPRAHLLESHFPVLFLAVGPDEPAQSGTFQLSKKWLNLCSVC